MERPRRSVWAFRCSRDFFAEQPIVDGFVGSSAASSLFFPSSLFFFPSRLFLFSSVVFLSSSIYICPYLSSRVSYAFLWNTGGYARVVLRGYSLNGEGNIGLSCIVAEHGLASLGSALGARLSISSLNSRRKSWSKSGSSGNKIKNSDERNICIYFLNHVDFRLANSEKNSIRENPR